LCKDSQVNDCDRIVESVQFREGAVVVQCVNDEGCRKKADSKVERMLLGIRDRVKNKAED
jgi:hypothetical protein